MLKSDPSTWTDARHRRGAAAEFLARRTLEAAGYRILEHRYRFHRHDVDLVARRGRVVAFVEVKSRSGSAFGAAAEAVTPRKRAELARAASAWLQRHGRPGSVARFDVVTVEPGGVSWLKDAFRPDWR